MRKNKKSPKYSVADFFKSITDKELLDFESIYNFHLTLTTNHQLGGENFSAESIKILHDRAIAVSFFTDLTEKDKVEYVKTKLSK